ncbi:MAG: site-specific integrase [Thermodesulfobacteriota bacterium]|nr:site-specific integrase [Thermodesulfobacteriota bacterium]
MGVTVRQKVKGRGKPWWVFVSHNGRRTSKRVGDKDSAEAVASQIRARLKLGEFDIEKEKKKQKKIPLFKHFAQGFMETYSAMNHKPSTRESYQSALDNHINPVFGDMPLDAITRKNIKDFLNEKQKEQLVFDQKEQKYKKKRLSAASVRNLRAYLSCILSEAVDDEWIQSNPASRTGKLIKKQDRARGINPFTWEEKSLFEGTVKKHYPRYYPLFLTALRTGMRVGELVALKPGDLDFAGNFIHVRRGCVRGDISTPKSGKLRRVDMTDQLSRVLKGHLTERKKEAFKKGLGAPPEWLFYNNNGGMLDINHLRKRVFYKALEKAGLRRVRIHDLRHTYATLRISKGDNIADVSKQLGHHSIKITVDTYYHWMPGASKSEVDQLDFETAPGCTLYAPSGGIGKKKGAID